MSYHEANVGEREPTKRSETRIHVTPAGHNPLPCTRHSGARPSREIQPQCRITKQGRTNVDPQSVPKRVSTLCLPVIRSVDMPYNHSWARKAHRCAYPQTTIRRTSPNRRTSSLWHTVHALQEPRTVLCACPCYSLSPTTPWVSQRAAVSVYAYVHTSDIHTYKLRPSAPTQCGERSEGTAHPPSSITARRALRIHE